MLKTKDSVSNLIMQQSLQSNPKVQPSPQLNKAVVLQDAVQNAPNSVQQALKASGMGNETVIQVTRGALQGQKVLTVTLALDNVGTTTSAQMMIFDGSGMAKYKANINGTGNNPVSGTPLTGGGTPTISSTDWGSGVLTLFANFSNGNNLLIDDIKLINTSGNSIASGSFQEWFVDPNGQINSAPINFNVMRSASDLTSGIQNINRNSLTSSTYGILATCAKNDQISIVVSYRLQSAGGIMS